MKKLLIGLTLLLSLPVAAQDIKDTAGIRISWDANKPSDGIESYIVSWRDNDSGQWVALANVAHADNQTLEYFSRVGWLKNTLKVGDEICIQLIATKAEKRSPPSEITCDIIPDRLAAPEAEIPQVTITELTAPNSPRIEWTD